MDQFLAALEIKSVKQTERLICGYAAVFGNEDRVGDIIDPGAFTKTLAEKAPSAVGVFIGHKTNELPIGIPVVIRPDAQGLYTETKIFSGPMGDQLLETAAGLASHGLKLGMSIGYRLRQGRAEKSLHGGYAKRLLDIDLREYSFAAAQTIANEQALTTAVKTADDVAGEIRQAVEGLESDETKASVGSFQWTRGLVANAIRAKAGSSYIVEMFPDRVVYRVYGTGSGEEAELLYQCSYSISGSTVTMGEPTQVDVQYVPMPTTKTAPDAADPPERSSKPMADLPNSAYLYVEPGEDDADGLRVPRAKRHFAYKTAEGALSAELLEVAVKTIPTETLPEDVNRLALGGRAQRYLDMAHGLGTKTLALESPEWVGGVAAELSGLGDELRKTAETLSLEHSAMRLLGEDTKDSRRIRPETRARLSELAARITAAVQWAEMADAGAERKAAVDRYARELELLEIS